MSTFWPRNGCSSNSAASRCNSSALGELHLFVGPDFVITVRHGAAPDLAAVRRRLEDNPELLARGPEAVLYAILDAVVDGYGPVVAGVENDIDEIETEVFSNAPAVSRRIYELSREVVEFQRATRPLNRILAGLSAGFEKYEIDEELRRYLRDVADHNAHVTDYVDGFRQALQDILTVNATLVAQQQNEEMKALATVGHAQNEEIKKISAGRGRLVAYLCGAGGDTPICLGAIQFRLASLPGLMLQQGVGL